MTEVVAGAGSDHDLPSAQVKMVAGIRVDHDLLEVQEEAVARMIVNFGVLLCAAA